MFFKRKRKDKNRTNETSAKNVDVIVERKAAEKAVENAVEKAVEKKAVTKENETAFIKDNEAAAETKNEAENGAFIKKKEEFRSNSYSGGDSKKNRPVIKSVMTVFMAVLIVLSGLWVWKGQLGEKASSEPIKEVYAAEVGKFYWMVDETTETLHLSGVQIDENYELFDEEDTREFDGVVLLPWSMYYDSERISTIIFDSEIAPITTRYWFFDFSSLTKIENIENLNTSNVTDMSYMFAYCSRLTNLDVSGFDTSNVTDMSYIFKDCSSLTNLDLRWFDTGIVTNMSSMFSGCSKLTSLDVCSFDTSNVTDMSSMFEDCSGLTNLDYLFDTSNVTDMSYMFYDCSNLTRLSVSLFDTSKVTNMASMFYNCRNLIYLDVSGFDASKVTNMRFMFYNCQRLYTLDLSGFNPSMVTNMEYMFYDCHSLANLNVSGFDTRSVTNMAFMFRDCSSLKALDLSGFDTSNATNMSGTFYGCSGLTSLDVSSLDTSKVAYMDGIFLNCSKLTSLDLSSFDTRNVTGMNSMLYGCTSLASLDLGSFNTSKVKNMGYMFSDCSSLTNLDVSNFDVSNVIDMTSMFYDCSNLANLDLSGFNTSKVTSMNRMFYGCSGLTSLDLSSFDTRNVRNMSSMFSNCSPTIFSFSDSLVLKSNPSLPSSDYRHIRSADGTRLGGSEIIDLSTVMNDGFTAEEASQYAGTWVKPEYSGVNSLGDGNYEYVTIDDLWVKNGNVWTYTFKVFDDTMQYYAWEEYLNDYISINMANPDGTVSLPLVIDPALKSGAITNTSDNVGNLSISKTVEGAPASQADDKFTFNITLTGDKISGTQVFSDIVFKDGEAQIVLKDGESKVIENLPTGTTYAVTETQSSLYTTTYTGDTGTIEKGKTAKAEFINTYIPEKLGQPSSLAIVKKVEGNYETLPNQKYKFIVNLEGLDSNENYIYSQGMFKSDADGKALILIELEANEECVLLNLPEGTQYQVTEEAGKYKSSYTIQ